MKIDLNNRVELEAAVERLRDLRTRAKASDKRKIFSRILTYRTCLQDIKRREEEHDHLQERLQVEYEEEAIAQAEMDGCL